MGDGDNNREQVQQRTASHYQGGWRSHVTYILPDDEEKLSIFMNRHREDKKWLSELGGAILRRLIHMLRELPRKKQTDHTDDCLRRLTTGHQYATAAWIWQSMGLTWDPKMRLTTEYKQARHRLAQDCITLWTQGDPTSVGVIKYLNKQNSTIIRTLVGQLRDS